MVFIRRFLEEDNLEMANAFGEIPEVTVQIFDAKIQQLPRNEFAGPRDAKMGTNIKSVTMDDQR